MTEPTALARFREALGSAEELVALERRYYHNPPRQPEQRAVRGLRGAAAVLMVAAFEFYLRQSIEDYLSELTVRPLKVSLDQLPEKMRVNSVFNTLERAIKGPPFQDAGSRAQRLPEIDQACRMVISGTVNPAAFCETAGNPGAKLVKSLYKDMGIEVVFDRIKPQFDRDWGKTTAATFIPDKLDEIVNRRHVVAHTADALNISRSDLQESLKFMRILARLLDRELKRHVRQFLP